MADTSTVELYIQNEIDYINRYGLNSDKQDIPYLESLQEEDIKEITTRINNDSELFEKINELINYYLYHYEKNIELKEN